MKRVREDEPMLDPTVRDQSAALYVFKAAFACVRERVARDSPYPAVIIMSVRRTELITNRSNNDQTDRTTGSVAPN